MMKIINILGVSSNLLSWLGEPNMKLNGGYITFTFCNLDKNTSWFLIVDVMSSKHSPNGFCNDALYGCNILCTTNQNCWFLHT
jgi:hypothetical protein